MSFKKKVWEVLLPWLLYYLAYNTAYIILMFLHSVAQNKFGEGYGQWMAAHGVTAGGVVSGLCMLAGICPLLPSLKRELTKRVERDAGVAGKGVSFRTAGSKTLAVAVLAVSSSLGFNILLTLTGLADSSQAYQEVAKRQYGVAFGIGLFLYGLVSPLAEEVVFRGMIYNRLRSFCSPAAAVAVSGIFFGAVHGNLVQGVYGSCMGILIAYVYEREGHFFYPVLFHAAANIAVYSVAHGQAAQSALFTPAWGAVFLLIAAGDVVLMNLRSLHKRN